MEISEWLNIRKEGSLTFIPASNLSELEEFDKARQLIRQTAMKETKAVGKDTNEQEDSVDIADPFISPRKAAKRARARRLLKRRSFPVV